MPCPPRLPWQMGKHTLNAYSGKPGYTGRLVCRRLIRRHSNPAHARIHRQMDVGPGAVLYSCFRQFPGLLIPEHGRAYIVPDQILKTALMGHTQYQNHLLDAVAAQDDRLINGGHRVPFYVRVNGPGHRNRPVSVPVCLYHPDHGSGRRQTVLHCPHIGFHRIQVNGCVNSAVRIHCCCLLCHGPLFRPIFNLILLFGAAERMLHRSCHTMTVTPQPSRPDRHALAAHPDRHTMAITLPTASASSEASRLWAPLLEAAASPARP